MGVRLWAETHGVLSATIAALDGQAWDDTLVSASGELFFSTAATPSSAASEAICGQQQAVRFRQLMLVTAAVRATVAIDDPDNLDMCQSQRHSNR
jgi:hypothetical protein